MLKGFSHCPDFVNDSRQRVQYDLDLYLPPEQVYAARDAALQLGYEPIHPRDRRPTDHLPTMIRKTGWRWRGDFFDPDLPVSLELHFRFWDEQTEGFSTGPRPILGAANGEAPGRSVLRRSASRGCRGIRDAAFVAPSVTRRHSNIFTLMSWRGCSIPAPPTIRSGTNGRDCTIPAYAGWRRSVSRSRTGGSIAACLRPRARRSMRCRRTRPAGSRVTAMRPSTVYFIPTNTSCGFIGVWRNRKVHGSRFCGAGSLPAIPPGPADAAHVPEAELTWRMLVQRRWRYFCFGGSYAPSTTRAHLSPLSGRTPLVRRGCRFRVSILALFRRCLPVRFRPLHFFFCSTICICCGSSTSQTAAERWRSLEPSRSAAPAPAT